MIDEAKLIKVLAELDASPEAEELGKRSIESGTLLDFSRRYRALGVQPADAIEIGTYLGRSTHFFTHMVAPGEVHSIDISSEYHARARVLLTAHSHHVHLHLGDSLEILPRLLQTACFNFALIDGEHSCTHALTEYLLLERFIQRPGLIVMHDVSYVNGDARGDGGVPKAVAMLGDLEVKGDKAYKVVR